MAAFSDVFNPVFSVADNRSAANVNDADCKSL